MSTPQNKDNILDLIRMSFQAHSVALFLPSDEDSYSLVSISTLEEPYTEGHIIAPQKGLVNWIIQHQKPLILNRFDHGQHYLGYYTRQNEQYITSFMGCPLPKGGALCIDSTTQHVFTENDQEVLHRFARLVAKKLYSTGTETDNQKIRNYYSSLEHIIEAYNTPSWKEYLDLFLNHIANATDSDYATFVSSVEGSSTYTVEGENIPIIAEYYANNTFPLDIGGLISWVFRNEVPIFTEGSEGSSAPLFGKLAYIPEFPSAICIPIYTSKVICGVVCIASQTIRPIPKTMRIFLKMAIHSFTQYLDKLALTHKINKYTPQARVYHTGAVFHDPDTSIPQHSDESI